MLYDIITNKVLVISISAWAIAQAAKILVALLQGKGLELRLFVRSGGMPSAHSAMVAALATSVGIVQGFGSALFGFATIVALIVMYDSAGVRQSVSRQSAVLNRIIRELRLKLPITRLEADLRELIGHTPFQVIVGGALGITVAWLWMEIAPM
ncbi:MAG: divergent PAP2 family protein [Chloroflexi bacterium]|nr:divergent PAP2 family protein [Chloroflexota bacterium]